MALCGLFLFFAAKDIRGSAAQTSDSQVLEKDLERADTLVNLEKLDEAIGLLEGLSQKQPNAAGVEARLGKAYYRQRSFQKAIAHFKLALQQNSEDRETTQLLGLSFYAAGRLVDAIPLLERLQTHLPPTELDVLFLLGACYLRTQQPEKARATFARMFSMPPDSAATHLLLAQMMVRQHLEEQAVPELKTAMSVDPRLPMVHFLLGEIYLFESKPQLALEEFLKELEINPTVWLVYWRIGDAYARLEKYPEAERVLKQAIWLNETFTGPYVLLGQIALKNGDLKLAVGFLERAVKMDPNNYQAHNFLAKAYQQSSRPDDARREFEVARTLRMEKNTSQELLFNSQR
jgi:tetratricopeptide (TPR) repeat protein